MYVDWTLDQDLPDPSPEVSSGLEFDLNNALDEGSLNFSATTELFASKALGIDFGHLALE